MNFELLNYSPKGLVLDSALFYLNGGKNVENHLADQWMSRPQQVQWIKAKTDWLESYHEHIKSKTAARANSLIRAHGKMLDEGVLHEMFYAKDEDFDPLVAARQLNDYEVAILNDLKNHPQAHLAYDYGINLALCTEQERVKGYDLDHRMHMGMLFNKHLLKKQAPKQFVLNERGKLTLEAANELAKKEIEEWEMWRGMPSLYHLNDLEI